MAMKNVFCVQNWYTEEWDLNGQFNTKKKSSQQLKNGEVEKHNKYK